MITEIVVGILVLWTLYSEIQRYQVRKLMVDTLEGMDRSISSMKRVFSGKLLEQQKTVTMIDEYLEENAYRIESIQQVGGDES